MAGPSVTNTYSTQDSTGTAFTTFPITGACAQGDFLWLVMSWADAQTPAPSITDTQGNAWVFLDVTSGGGHFVAHYYARAKATGSLTVTATAQGGTYQFPGLFLVDIANANTLLGHEWLLNGAQSAGTPFLGGPINITQQPALFLSFTQDSGATAAASPNTGWTGLGPYGTFGSNIAIQTQTGLGAAAGSWLYGNGNSGYYELAIAVYNQVGGLPGVPPTTTILQALSSGQLLPQIQVLNFGTLPNPTVAELLAAGQLKADAQVGTLTFGLNGGP